MKTAEFILLAVAKNISIAGKNRYAPVPWWFRFEMHKLTKRVDYGCKFNDEGRCQGRDYSDKGCCSGCDGSIGYYSVLPGPGIYWGHHEVLPVLAKNYSRKLGFWRPKTGCVLPREIRSSTCVRFKCLELKTPFEKWLVFAVSDIENFYKRFEEYMSETHGCMVIERDHEDKHILEFMEVYMAYKEREEKTERNPHIQLSLFKRAKFMGEGTFMA